MEAGLAADRLGIVVERDTLLSNGGVEVFEGLEVFVGDGLVDVGPEGFGGLELRGIGRQVDEADALRHGEAGSGVPAGAVEHEEDDAVAPRAGLSWAKSASVSSKSALSTPVPRYQKLSPVAGETKTVT